MAASALSLATRLPTEETTDEMLAIAAMVDTGQWSPGKHGLTRDMFIDAKGVYDFCADYSSKTGGAAPPIHLVVAKNPGYKHQNGVSIDWAATRVQSAHQSRRTRSLVHKGLTDLTEGDFSQAGTHLMEAARACSSMLSHGVSMSSAEAFKGFQAETVPVPHKTLQEATGGHRMGSIWLVAGRLGTGKTFRLCEHTLHASRCGWDVEFFSLEMPTEEVSLRLAKMAIGKDLNTKDADIWRDGFAAAMGKEAGHITIHDTSKGVVDPTVVAGFQKERTLVVVDYINLVRAPGGGRQATDWRIAAEVSNTLREVCTAYKVPVLAGAQLNRLGEMRNAGASALAGTDAFGQDADVVLALRQESRGVLHNRLVKNRHGRGFSNWYTRFDPDKNDWREMEREAALQLAAEQKDEDRMMDV